MGEAKNSFICLIKLRTKWNNDFEIIEACQ